jgi:glycosyltransferase involved in cell wall biosynthesis
MSVGMSMDEWNRVGIIHRELAYYKELSQHIGPLSFISYGNNFNTETQLLKQSIPDADIVWIRSSKLSDMPGSLFLASFIPPFYYKSFTKIKAVRTNQISGSWAGELIAKQLHVPFILRAGYLMSKNIRLDQNASVLKKKLLIFLEKWVVRRADAIIVTYSNAKKYLINQYDISPSIVSVIGNPIDVNVFCPQKQRISTRRNVLFIGRFTPEKNIGTILLACHQANVSITLLGRGPLKKMMLELAASLKLDAQFIDFMPNQQIPKLMSNHQMFVIASHYEGNPKVLLEAMSCEMPCIASNIPEHIDVINHEKEGLVVPSTPDSLAKAMQIILGAPSFARKLGECARQKILKAYSLKANALQESLLHERISQERIKTHCEHL